MYWQIEGRSLEPEMITLGASKVVSAGREADWSRELTRSAVISAVCSALCLYFVARQYACAICRDVTEPAKIRIRRLRISYEKSVGCGCGFVARSKFVRTRYYSYCDST